MRRKPFTWIAAALLAWPGWGDATPITIDNAGFESPVTSSAIGGGATDWTLTGSNGASSGGVWNINDSPLGFWTVPAPEGKQVGWLSPAVDPNGPADYSQVLGDSLQSNTLYTLTGFVGHPLGFGATKDPDTLFTVELLAGSNVLASDSGTGPEGTFAPFSLVFDSSGSAFVGQALQVRLATSQAQTAYDKIGLDATVIPEPSSSLLFMVGSALLLAGLRKPRVETPS